MYIARNKEIIDKTKRKIAQGGTSHEPYIIDTIGLVGLEEKISPVVALSNIDDGYYI